MSSTSQVPRAALAAERLVRLPELEVRLSLKKSAIYQAMKTGEFPKNVRLIGNRSVAWRESDILAFIQSRAEVQA